MRAPNLIHAIGRSCRRKEAAGAGCEHHRRRYLGRYTVCLPLTVLALAGCAVGPDYKRPDTGAPAEFRRATTDTAAAPAGPSFADLGWREAFKDPQLAALIGEALEKNADVRIAAARVLRAEAAARVVRSQYFPTVAAGGDYVSARGSEIGPTPVPPGTDTQVDYTSVYAAVPAWEIDFWGRIRRANEAARAQLLGSVESQRSVRQRLIADVATSYLNLLELDLELEIATRTLEARRRSLDLTQSREEGGVASMQDVYQARILVSTAEATIADTHRRLEQEENLMSILLGRNPGRIARGASLVSHELRADVPAGLPSALLDRRPDVRLAEQQLIAANASIGQARAAFFPTISLTGSYGYQSVEMSELFSSPAQTWQFGPNVTLPIFTGGRLRSNLKVAEAEFQAALATYQQTVQQAFREVSDALIGYQRLREFRARQEERTQAHRGATELAGIRYEGGVTSYLEVLYNEQELFNAELDLAKARRNEHLSVVQLYRALGGGWPAEAPMSPK